MKPTGNRHTAAYWQKVKYITGYNDAAIHLSKDVSKTSQSIQSVKIHNAVYFPLKIFLCQPEIALYFKRVRIRPKNRSNPYWGKEQPKSGSFSRWAQKREISQLPWLLDFSLVEWVGFKPHGTVRYNWFRVRYPFLTFQILCVSTSKFRRAEKVHHYWVFSISFIFNGRKIQGND